MDEKIYRIAEQIVQLHQKAYEFYLPLVEDVCNKIISMQFGKSSLIK